MDDTTTNTPAGLQNVRDVGGLPASDGGRVRSGVLVRSDAPFAGDPPPDVPAWPPAVVLDLRASGEASERTHPLAAAGADVRSVSLSPGASIAGLTAEATAPTGGLEAVYRDTIDAVGRSFAVLAQAIATADGPVLVHCTAGKDRTGMLVAVVLAAVGVPRAAILADYTRTDVNMDGVLARVAGQSGATIDIQRVVDEHPELLATSVPALSAILDRVEATPGGAGGWLVAQGLTPQRLQELRERLVQRP